MCILRHKRCLSFVGIYICILLLQVVSVAVNSGLVAYPVKYNAAYSTSGLTIWEAVPPEGYVALGCLAAPGDSPPSLTEMVTVHASIGVEAPLGSCLVLQEEKSWRSLEDDMGHLTEKPKANVWCIDNVGASFVVCSPEVGSPIGKRVFIMPSSTHCYSAVLALGISIRVDCFDVP